MNLCNLELERAVLGCCFISEHAVQKVAVDLTDRDFKFEETKLIFKAIRHLFSESKSVDLITVRSYLENAKVFEIVGVDGLKKVFDIVPTSTNVDSYIKDLKHLEHRRRCLEFSERIASAVMLETDIRDVYKVVSDIPEFASTEFKHLTTDQILQNAVDSIAERQQQKKSIPGLPTGFADLDKITGGMKDGEIIAVTAHPNVGKSILAQNIATNVAQQGKRVDLFSYEMTVKQLGDRLLPALSGVASHVVQFPSDYMTDEDINNIAEMKNDKLAKNLHIYADELTMRTVAEIKAKVKSTSIRTGNGPDLIIIDYLQLLEGAGESWEVAGDNALALKRLAREFNCPVIFIASLAKDGTIRGSGQILFDADQWWQLEREHDAEDRVKRCHTELHIKKNRDGGKGKVELLFLEKFLKFGSTTRV